MGVKEKANEAPGLAFLLGRTGSIEPSIRANVVKQPGQQRGTALAHIFDGHTSPPLVTSEGSILFPAVAELIRQHVKQDALSEAAEADTSFDPSASGRIGPRTVRLDEGSAAGDIRIDDLTVESLSNFSSARATTAIFKGKWMYEVILGTCGIQQIGWATLQCPFTSEEGVGDAPDSYAWDGKRVQRWNVSPHPYGTPWASGDVIGVCADMEAGTLSFVKNGTDMGVAFSSIRNFQPGAAFFPALSISHGERSELNFGSQPFRYPVEGYQPIQDPPSPAQREAAQYLLTAFRRLVRLSAPSDQAEHTAEVFVPPSAAATATGATIDDIDMLVDGPHAYAADKDATADPRRLLSVDDAVLLAAALARHLGPLLEDPYLVSHYVLPMLQELLGKGPEHDEPLLGWAVQLLDLVLELHEAQAMYSQLFAVLARAARTEQLCPSESPYAGPYSAVALAAALLRVPAARRHMLADTGVMERIEALLTRKLVTSRELRVLLPTVWWSGAQSQAGDDSRVSQSGFASAVEVLEKALDVVEQRQYQVVEALARAPRDELGDEDDDDNSDVSSSRGAGEGGAQRDTEMAVEAVPAPAAVATGSVIQRLMRALEGAGQAPRAATLAQRDAPGAGGGLPVGGDGEEGVGTALSAFLEHLITKNSGATRNIQPVGLSEPSVLVTTYYALVRLLTPRLEAALGQESAVSSLATFPAAASFLQGLEGSRKDRIDRYSDMARLGGTAGHLVREFPPGGLDHSAVAVPLLERSPTSSSVASDVQLGPGELAGLLDAAMLLYYLGLAPVLKNAAYQASSQEASVAQLADVERRLAGAATGAADYARHLREAQHVFRDDIVDNTRLTTWNKIWLNGRWKREVMFQVTVYVARMLMEVGKREALFRYVPEFYVEAVVDACHALRGSAADDKAGDSEDGAVLAGPGLSDIIVFLTLYFHDTRIINPDIREALLQSISMLMQSSRFVQAFADNPVAREKLMASLLAAFDQRSWVTISNILVRITFGLGFGQSKTGKHMATASQQLSALLHQACLAQPDVLAGFLNRLFNTLNWTVTEFTVSLKDVHDMQRAARRADQNVVRRCILMFELSVNLARILEVLATQLPETFLRGSSISLTRLLEVLSFILSHTTDGAGAAVLDAALSTELSPLKAKVSRPLLLAPLVGILTALHAWEEANQGGSSAGGAQQLSILHELAASEMCPMRALEYAATLDWASPSAKPSLGAIDPARVAHFQTFVQRVKERRAAEAAAAADELEADGEVPDEFLDPLLQMVMRDPVTLPDSHITVDRSTIERHLLGSKTDPFNRSPLTLEALQPNDVLRARIQAWQQQRLVSKAARTTA